LRWRPLLMRVIPRALRHRRAHRLALEQFYSHNLHQTRERTGVLLFVSVAERYVEIIADKGIDEVVNKDAWRAIVDAFIGQVRAGRVGDGFVEAVDACGALLAGHFPADGAVVNELSDHLVEI
jgi:putative membrane protein